MQVAILGSAAGGGFPQWNCACRNCCSVRKGTFPGKARNQLQVAVSRDGSSWFLLNASPDLRQQIEAFPALHPRAVRHTPIAAVILTSSDLDQILGLLLLREFQQFRVYATPAIQRILREDNSIFSALNRVPDQIEWVDIRPRDEFALASCQGANSGLNCKAVSLPAAYPAFVTEGRAAELSPSESLLGLIIEDGGKRIAYFPAVPGINASLLRELDRADVILFDGTFWSDDELSMVRGTGPTARQIGHVPISGSDGSLELLAGLSKRRKIFVHVNNTNPILDESSVEHRAVRTAGWEIAEDGWQLTL